MATLGSVACATGSLPSQTLFMDRVRAASCRIPYSPYRYPDLVLQPLRPVDSDDRYFPRCHEHLPVCGALLPTCMGTHLCVRGIRSDCGSDVVAHFASSCPKIACHKRKTDVKLPSLGYVTFWLRLNPLHPAVSDHGEECRRDGCGNGTSTEESILRPKPREEPRGLRCTRPGRGRVRCSETLRRNQGRISCLRPDPWFRPPFS
jgi:hypothetical protein